MNSTNQELSYWYKIIEEKYHLVVNFDESGFIKNNFNKIIYIETKETQYTQYIFRASLNKRFIPHSDMDYKFEIDTLNKLKDDTIDVSYPIPQSDGYFHSKIKFGDEEWFCCLFSYATGQSYFPFNQEQYYQEGKTLAQIHLSLDDFHSEYSRYAWDFNNLFHIPLQTFETFYGRIYSKEIGWLKDLGKKIEETFTKTPLEKEARGWIHGDYHSFNMHFSKQDEITVFDFDWMGYGIKAFDVACFLCSEEVWDLILPKNKEERN